MPEIAGGAAEIIDPYDFLMLKKAMIHILSNAEVYSGYVKRGLKRCKNFTWRASAEKLLMIYNQNSAV
jgi:glycosyltransferase involved in cell wall biosynthesis